MNNSEFLPLLLSCTLRGSALILLGAVAAPLIRRGFGPNGAHFLWLAALVALLWPWPPRTPLSLGNLLPSKVEEVRRPLRHDQLMGPTRMRLIDLPLQQLSPAAESPKPGKPTAYIVEPLPRKPPFKVGAVCTAIWLAGVGLMLLRLAWRWRQTRRIIKASRELNEMELAALPDELPAGLRLAVSSRIAAPALAGIWRPRVLLPEGWLATLEPQALRVILLHECGHHRRRDLVWEWLFALATCAHWMNPLAWLAAHLARHERELACDAWVLERTRSPEQYGLALLEVIQRMGAGARGGFGAVAMADRLSPVSLRLKRIRGYRRTPKWLAALAWMPALLVLGALGTDRFEARAEKGPSDQENAELPKAGKTEAGPIVPLPPDLRAVEVTSRVLRIPESLAKSLQLPIAQENSKGVQKILGEKDQRELLKRLNGNPAVEILPIPRLISRTGQRTLFSQSREIRYPTSYEVAAGTPGLQVPKDFESAELGISMETEAVIVDQDRVALNIVPKVVSMAGFVDEAGQLTPKLEPEAGLDWFGRLTTWEMPGSAAGVPAITTRKGDLNLELNSAQSALVFGFPDAEELTATGEPMINYILLQMHILQ